MSGGPAPLAEELLQAIDLLEPPTWEPADRPPLLQVPPEGEWWLWLLEGGRGSGKTEACVRYFALHARAPLGARQDHRPDERPRGRNVRARPVRAAVDLPRDPVRAASAGGVKLFWPSGWEALAIGTAAPRDVERLRAR